MENLKPPSTPVRSSKLLPQNKIQIPPSPLLKKIGFGTGVAVYELKRSPSCNKIQSPWAIKKLLKRHKNAELDQRLCDEASVLRKLNHPNVVGFRAFVQDASGNNVLAMEECSTSLGDLIEIRNENNFGPYPIKTIIKVIVDTANALNYLHNEMLLLHCDVKSYNILIKGEFDVCKLCDFGVSLPLTKSGEIDRKQTGNDVEYAGTPAWYAPEIFDFPQVITTAADIYALGLVVYEMLALIPPVDNEMMESLDELSFDDFLPVSVRHRPDLPSEINLSEDYNVILEIYFCCTDADRTKRPTAQDLIVLGIDLNSIFN